MVRETLRRSDDNVMGQGRAAGVHRCGQLSPGEITRNYCTPIGAQLAGTRPEPGRTLRFSVGEIENDSDLFIYLSFVHGLGQYERPFSAYVKNTR